METTTTEPTLQLDHIRPSTEMEAKENGYGATGEYTCSECGQERPIAELSTCVYTYKTAAFMYRTEFFSSPKCATGCETTSQCEQMSLAGVS